MHWPARSLPSSGAPSLRAPRSRCATSCAGACAPRPRRRRTSASSWTRYATCGCWSGLGAPRAAASASSVGYSVALPPAVEDSQRAAPAWHGAGRLDKSLALGQLRARWGANVAGDPSLTAAWTQRWTTRDVADKVRASEPPRDAASALAGLCGALGDGGQHLAAADAAGVFARASIALEKDKPGPLAKLSGDLARAAQPSAYTAEDRDRQWRENAALGAAYVSRLMARGTGSDSRTGWIAVMREAERTARAIAHAQALQRRAAAAVQTNRALVSAVASVPQLSPPPAPGTRQTTQRRKHEGAMRPACEASSQNATEAVRP